MSLPRLNPTIPPAAETREPKGLTRAAASNPVFEDGVKNRGSGSTLSKPSGSETEGSRRVDF